jgi:hypothetical protein
VKVYNKLVVDIETGEHLEEDSYEYEGPVAQCVWAAVSAIAAVASAVIGATGAVISADSQRKAANYNADRAEQNAKAAEEKAAYDERMHRESVRKILSAQRALYGDSGLSMEGSPLLVMEDSTKQAELDALAIRYGGDINAAQQRSSANLLRMQGANAQTAGYITAGTTLLSGAKAAGAYFKPTAKKD